MDQISTAPHETRPAPAPRRRRGRIFPIVLVVLALAIVLLVLLWNWDWFIPLVDARASAALGRRVSIEHLHVRLGRRTTVTADHLVIANPDGFAAEKPLASVGRLSVTADVMEYWHHRTIVLPAIGIDHPDLEPVVLSSGQSNFTFKPAAGGGKPAAPPQIGELTITDGIGRFVDPRAKSDFALAFATFAATAARPSEMVLNAKGTYAAQPVTARFAGGALLTLRDTQHPYSVDLRVENGPTHASLVGTVENPLNFAGARLKLSFAGPDLALLYPLTGVPLPQTAAFSIAGNLDFQPPTIRFTDFAGRVGGSDVGGTVLVNTAGARPDVTMDLVSRRVDLADLGGLIGAKPVSASARPGAPGSTTTVVSTKPGAAKKSLFPDTPLNLPKLRTADLHVKYRGEHIENRYTPFDRLIFDVDVVDGRITFHPLDFVIGSGSIASSIDLRPGPHDVVHAVAKVRFRDIDLTRLMQATHTFRGRGLIGGDAEIDTDGNSMASMMAQGNGELKLILVSGGNLSALLIDIAGLEFGNALLSALGVPNRANIDCFVTDLPMHQGIVTLQDLLLDTDEARLVGRGTMNFRDQTLDISLTTRSKHFSIGSLPGPINVSGPLGSPSIRPGTEIVARAGAAAALGVVLTPLGALLPTIQFGVGNDNACYVARVQERKPLRAPAPPRTRAHK